MVDGEGEEQGGREDVALVGADVGCTGAGCGSVGDSWSIWVSFGGRLEQWRLKLP